MTEATDRQSKSGSCGWRRIVRRVVFITAVLLVFEISWYAVARVCSPLNAVQIHGESPAPLKVETASPESLRIASYNIAHGRGRAASNWEGGSRAARESRLAAIADLLGEADVDVIVLNEVDFDSTWSGGVNQAHYISERIGMPYLAEQRNFDIDVPFFSCRTGNAVLSRYPIIEAEVVDYPSFSRLETILAGKKRGMVCTLDLGGSRRVDVLAVHLEYRAEATRVESAQCILKLADDAVNPLIAAGDFNSTPIGFPESQVDSAGRSAMSKLLVSGRFATLPDGQPVEEDLTFRSFDPDRIIDWVLVPPDWSIVSREVLKSDLSDHLPVIMEVRLPPGER